MDRQEHEMNDTLNPALDQANRRSVVECFCSNKLNFAGMTQKVVLGPKDLLWVQMALAWPHFPRPLRTELK